MSRTLLTTKFYAPPARPDCVQRPRLISQLNQGLQRKLTLVSASAGFGKSTLVSTWIKSCQHPVAWLSLDENDSDTGRFVTYLVEALNTAIPSCIEATAAALRAAQPANPEPLLTILLNELNLLSDRLILVLDDYHLIDAQSIDQALGFLIEHLPKQIHLVIATREDPQLPLARLRARGQMTELRAADLRFTASEASEFLNQMMGLELSEQNIAALEIRTEGWIAGLQMAALSMQGRKDTAEFIAGFSGGHRFILDYLAQEVLQHQHESVQEFLWQTSILKRLSATLCDAVTGRRNGQDMLRLLERENLFVIPLDDHRRWYRYHHLFGEVLRARLSLGDKELKILHRRASEWLEQNHLLPDAIDHALAAKDYDRAAALVELVWPKMRKDHPETLFLSWLRAIPNERLMASPVLCIHQGFALLQRDVEAALSCLQQAEYWRDLSADATVQCHVQPNEMVVVNQAEFQSLSGLIAIARGYHAGSIGNIDGIVEYSRIALDVLPERESAWRGAAAALLGIAYWTSGDLEAAWQSVAEGSVDMQRAQDTSGLISTLYCMAALKVAQGQLRNAERHCRKALKISAEHGEPAAQGTADIYVVLSTIHYNRGELEVAEQLLYTGRDLGGYALLPEVCHHWYIGLAAIRQAQGNFEEARELLEEASELQVDSPSPDARPIAAWQARLALARGQCGDAMNWLRERGIHVDDELCYLQEFEHLTLVKILIAEFTSGGSQTVIEQAMILLARLKAVAEAGDGTDGMIEILILQVLGLHALGETAEALTVLNTALSYAAREKYIQPFVDAGEPMRELLQTATPKGEAAKHARQVQIVLGKSRNSPAAVQRPLLESLSERELDVLKLLAGELSGPEIASQLFVSLNTLRTHTKHIYNKLDVNSRRAAVRRSEELDLL
ncbi:MAG: LuxR C-terminal-related transcriptional regulator [Granulosicoccus sp.]